MQYRIERWEKPLADLNQVVWEAAELKFSEYRSAQALADFLSTEGYSVEMGIGGLPTAFRATYGSGSPVIGLLAEYDALDGLSQQPDRFEKCVRPDTTHGHGCGHNLLGVACVGAALELRDYLRDVAAAGTVQVIGCPGEEGGSGKTYMARAGVFNELDVALTWHPCTINASMGCSTLANCQAYFRFHGKASHAAAAPQNGRSALDAVELMNVGVNYLREHMEMTDRVHYAVTNTGGISPNVVQAEAEVLYLVRSSTNEGAKILYERVCDIARGAALMTQTKLDIVFDKACSNVVPNTALGHMMHEQMLRLGPPAYTPEERAWVKKYHQIVGQEAVLSDDGGVPHYNMDERRALIADHPMADFVLPYSEEEQVMTGSSDIGDVSRIVPLVQIETACFTQGAQPHSWLWATQGTSSYALKGMIYAAQVMAEGAKQILSDPELLKKAKAEHHRRIGGQDYQCPIPNEVQPAPSR